MEDDELIALTEEAMGADTSTPTKAEKSALAKEKKRLRPNKKPEDLERLQEKVKEIPKLHTPL